MRHWHDEDLIAYYYGDHPQTGEIAAALAARPELRARYEELRRDLAAMPDLVPALPADYGESVWRALRPRLQDAVVLRGPWRAVGTRSFWALAAALILVVAAAYLLGRASGPAATPAALAGFSVDARQRIYVSAVAHHLEQAEVLLVGVANGGPELAADTSAERMRADDLLLANRLYRSAAREVGESGLVPLLAELEVVLLELAHLPASAADLRGIRERLLARDLLFKVRVVETRLRHQLQPPAPRRAGAHAAASRV
jgi:hypothetical protein